MVQRRDVIDWAPEKRQRTRCLFRRQTPELKKQKYYAGLAAEVILAVRRLPTTSVCIRPIGNPHPSAGYRRSAFDHRHAAAPIAAAGKA
jgi:hypothetical protein